MTAQYTLKVRRFWMFYYKYEILFRDEVVWRLIGGTQYYEGVLRIKNMLNAAYTMGYVEGTYDGKEEANGDDEKREA